MADVTLLNAMRKFITRDINEYIRLKSKLLAEGSDDHSSNSGTLV